MATHLASQDLLDQGFRILADLALDAEYQVHIATAGALPILVNGLRRHIDYPGFVEAGLCALNNLAFNKANKVALVSSDAVAVVVRCLETHVMGERECNSSSTRWRQRVH